MKLRDLSFLALITLLIASSAFAQRNIEQVIDRDPIMEADAKHNLDVAWQAFGPGKKAYKQVLLRFEETFAAYPTFSRINEFLYLAGMSSYYLSKNEGKQKVNLNVKREKERYAPEKLREEAATFLGLLLQQDPETKYKAEVEKVLKELEAQK